jgi:glycosyltransferase involved in cell wall biosynthesis
MMMETTPFVSVVVATYNREKMLGECIDSLFSQTYLKDRYEVIIINDGSHDGTEGVLLEYQKKAPCGFKWFSQPNSGQTVAFNRGIENSGGEIVCITGDDCLADKRWVENLVRGYTSEEVGGVGGIIEGIGTNSLLERYLKKNMFFSQENGINVAIIGGNSSFRKHVLDEVSGFDTFFRHGQDTEICMRIRELGYRFMLAKDAIILHRHKETIGGVLEQTQRYERTYVRLHKKYTKNFYPLLRALSLSKILLKKTIITPLKVLNVFFVEDKKFYLFENLFDFLVLFTMITGLIVERCLGKPYLGTKITKRLDFIEKTKVPLDWGL